MAKTKSPRVLPRILFWLSLLLFAAGLVIQVTGLVVVQPGVLFGAGLITLALNILLGGDIIVGSGLQTFSARGQVVRSQLEVKAGLCDLSIGKGPDDRVALLRYGPMGQPQFSIDDGVGRLSLQQSVLKPNISHWQTGLAANILWDVDVRSGLGDINLNLTDLRVEEVHASTSFGRIQVACPRRGYVHIQLSSGLGQVEVVLPEANHVGVRLRIERGTLSSLTFKTAAGRLLDAGDNHYHTPDFEQSDAHVEIDIRSPIGDVVVSERIPPSV